MTSSTLEFPTTSPAPHRRAKRLRVALAGCGVVGGEVVRQLRDSAASLRATHGVEVEITRILVREPCRERLVPLAPALATSDVSEFLAAPADVVIEAIGGIDPAAQIARAALANGRRFITANKALLAAHGAELAREARRTNTSLGCAASVGGGTPFVRLVRQAPGAEPPRRIRGILNGTSNFVLTLIERGRTLDEALSEARRRGFAEADATRDLDGRDAADKIAVLAWAAYGAAPDRLRVHTRGALPDPSRLVEAAHDLGGSLRLIAECTRLEGGAVTASVAPTIVSRDGSFAATTFEQNVLELDLGWSTPLAVRGPGAGGQPTAAAIVSDLLASTGGAFAPPHLGATTRDDTTPHRWVVSAIAPRHALTGALALAGIDVERILVARGESRAILSPVPAPELDRALAGVQLWSRAELVVARLDEDVV